MPAFKNFEKPMKIRGSHLLNVRFFPFREVTPCIAGGKEPRIRKRRGAGGLVADMTNMQDTWRESCLAPYIVQIL